MAPAVGTLARLRHGRSPPTTPAPRLLSNTDGTVVQSGREYLTRLVDAGEQPGPLGPLHADHGRPRRHRADRGPAGRHARRASSSARCPTSRSWRSRPPTTSRPRATSSPGTARPSPLDTSPTWRMLVAPAKGIFLRVDADDGDALEPGVPGRPRQDPPRRAAGPRTARRHDRRVARRGRRPGRPRPAARPPAPARQRRVTAIRGLAPRQGAPYAPHPRRRLLPPVAGRHQRRDLRAHRLARRVDP